MVIRMQQLPAVSVVLIVLTVAMAACSQSPREPLTHDDVSPAANDTADSSRTTAVPGAGKPTAPIDIKYKVIGSAFVGQPVSIEIDVSSTLRDQPMSLEYRINDPRDLAFADAQPPRVALSAIGDAPSARRQVTVVPQREGRLYLNVSAEIETDAGTMIKAMAIPIQVGSAPRASSSNGELKQDADGDTVKSLPAEEH